MLLGSGWELLGLPSSQVGLMLALFGIACRVIDRLLLLLLVFRAIVFCLIILVDDYHFST
jgi:hypothetical protein